MSNLVAPIPSLLGALVRPIVLSATVLACLLTGQSATAADHAPLTVVASIDVLPDIEIPGNEELAWAAFRSYIAAMRAENPAVTPVFLQRDVITNHFLMIEVWPNVAAFNAHDTMPAAEQLRSALTALLGSLFDQRLLIPMDDHSNAH